MPGSVMSEKICRLCLHREGDFFDLFAPSIKGLANLVDQLEPILNFKIVNDVRLPRVICSNCYKIQAFINEFRISCSRINGYLNELIDVSAPNSRDGPWEQTAIPVVNNEQSYDNAPEKKSKPMKPSVDDVKSCITDDESGKNLNPLVCEENMKEKLGNSSNSSVVSDGKTWKKNLKTNRVETSQPPMHSNTIQRSSTIDEKKEHFRFFELKDTYVRTAASISDRMKELNGRSMKYVRNNNSPGDSGCKDISETPPLEDEDTIELKLAPEYFLKTGITEEINVTNKVVNEAMGEDHHWNPGELHTVELQVKNEDVGLGGFDFNKLEEAPQMESINHGTRAYGSNSLNAHGEQNPNEITSSSIDINKVIYVKLLEMQKTDVKLTTDVIKGTALNVATEYGLSHFSGSDGWLHSFIKRYEMVQRSDELKLPAYSQGITLTNCYITRYCCKELNEAVYDLCCEMSACGVDLKSCIIKKCARRIAVNEGLYEFSASASWYKSFKKCYNLDVRDRKTRFKNT